MNALSPSGEEALASWALMVRANREQAERFREGLEGPDFYAPTASIFAPRAGKTTDEVLDILRATLKPDDTLLDIGAGGGRVTLPLARHVREIIAIEPSQAMRSTLSQGMSDQRIQNIRILADRWPVQGAPIADVVLISHVGYDIEDIGPFLDVMEASARRLCVAALGDRTPGSSADSFWLQIHGEKRVPLPSLREFLILQLARQRLCEVRLAARQAQSYSSQETLVSFLRQQLFIKPDGEKDRRLTLLVEQRVKEQEGQLKLSSQPGVVGVVSWAPR